jgi:hypothetical protein
LRKSSLLIVLIVLALSVDTLTAQKPRAPMLRGVLLQSDSRPLPYTELELVPIGLDRIPNDPRFLGVSDSRGRFIFQNVPLGKYTLSINFDGKPTFLSPYSTYFYPGSDKREKAQVFDISSSTQMSGLAFKLPDSFVKKVVVGKAVWQDGSPVAGALIGCRDTQVEIVNAFGNIRTDSKGKFTVEALVGRTYQFAAILFDRDPGKRTEDYTQIIGFGESDILRLGASDPPIVITVRRSKHDQRLLDKYVAQIVPQKQTPLDLLLNLQFR